MNEINKLIDIKKKRIRAMESKPLRNYFKIQKEKKKIQAIEESARDILNTNITNRGTSTEGEIDKNNYKTYSSQVNMAYKMYDSESDYGSELLKGIIETRNAFITGEGLSIACENKAVEEYLSQFITDNKLNGSRLNQCGFLGEIEGRCLMVILPDNINKKIKVRNISWSKNPYTLSYNKLDNEIIDLVKYKPNKDENEEIPIKGENLVYVKLGGSGRYENSTSSRIHTVLTDIENYSRAKYDLRKNTHVFGKYMPYWKTDTSEAAQAINNAIADRSWEIGDGYAGSAQFSIVEPTGNAARAIIEDMTVSLKCISVATGIPIHWLAFPELMSNRSTADSMVELVAASTKKERLLWEEGFTELFKKVITKAIDNGFEGNELLNDLDTLEVRLPMISLELIKQVAEVWLPLFEANIISKQTLMNRVPGIDPYIEKERLEEEQEENAENSPLNTEMKLPTEKEIEDDTGKD